jgi:hypothetical protein
VRAVGFGRESGMMEYMVSYLSGDANGAGASDVPAKWTIQLPTDTRAIKIPVEFKDLPLP